MVPGCYLTDLVGQHKLHDTRTDFLVQLHGLDEALALGMRELDLCW